MTPRLRLSAAAILLRGGPSTREVFLGRRSDALRFFGGTFAFCGGTVSRRDRVRCGDDEDLLLRYALARELFEETGLLLTADRTTPEQRERSRREVLDDPEAWSSRHAPGSLRLDTLQRVLQLVTPDYYPARFDTWFFLLQVDRELPGQDPVVWPGELVEGRWDSPAGWLRAWRRGEQQLSPPVLHLLQLLESAAPSDDLVEHLREANARFMARPPLDLRHDPVARVLPLRTPTLPPARHTNAYVLGRAPAYVVDPATPHADQRKLLDTALQQEVDKGARLQATLLTHHHADHVGAAEYLRERWNLPVWAHPETAARLEGKVRVDRHLEDGERLELGVTDDGREDWSLECIFTPGHAAGHLCFLDSHYGSLVCGDMMSTLSSILVHPDDGDMGQYMRSLRSLVGRGVQVIHPAHGPADARGELALHEQIAHREHREASVLGAVEAGATDLAAVVEAVYWDVPHAMRGYAALSVRSILAKLESEGKVGLDGEAVHLA